MKCCLCNKDIEVIGNYDEGHNAEPLIENGRCCDGCNSRVVIPARAIKLLDDRHSLECEMCNGAGAIASVGPCPECKGTGKV
jgi:DnaJ-class molecular chaperone